MPTICLFDGTYTQGTQFAERLVDAMGLTRRDELLMESVAKDHGVSVDDLTRAIQGPAFLFNKYTRKRERLLVMLKEALVDALSEENGLIVGPMSHLIPRSIPQILHVALVADTESRIKDMMASRSLSDKEAEKQIHDADAKSQQWTQYLFGLGAWDKSLFDMKIPLHELGMDKALELVQENAGKVDQLAQTKAQSALTDFGLSIKAEKTLVEAGILHRVSCENGVLRVVVDEYVMRLEKLEEEITALLKSLAGVNDVQVMTGPNYRPASMFSTVDFDLPEKVLLVDDEKDFVLTLSERLEMRDLEPAVAYTGEEALDLLREEEPDVMVLDLKMPGIDGIEVLKRVKTEHPQVEVIILTGHGSEKDRELCMSLGAFAYLEKPVDIEELSATMKTAREKIKAQA